MRFFIFISIFLYVTHFGYSQMIQDSQTQYGHEWIEDGKTYYKISISADGIYRISYRDLIDAGIVPDRLVGSHLFIINLGRQIPIFVTNSDILNNEDYILFYGEKNRGKLDQYLYKNPDADQLNSDYSLYTDNNTYYLSWDDTKNNLRYSLEENHYSPNNLPSKERFYEHVDKQIFSDLHFKPTHNGRDFIRYSSYDKGEGYGSNIKNHTIVSFQLDKIYNQGTRPKVKARYTGNASNHFIETRIKDLILNKFASNGYGVNDFSFSFNPDHLTENLDIEIVGVLGANDRHSLASITLSYAREYDFRGESEFYFELGASFIPRYLEIENFDYGNGSPILFDIQNNEIFYPVVEEGMVKVVIPAGISARKLLLLDPDQNIYPVAPLVNFKKQLDLNSIGDYIIISNNDLYSDESGINWVQKYANYRSSSNGGMYNPTIINISQLYDLFSYGIEGHSLSIKNFINYLMDQGHDIKAIFLIGKGLEYPVLRKKASLNDEVKCHIPTFGSPGGDNLFASRGFNNFPEISIGRLAAQTPDEIKNYLTKVKSFEQPIDYSDDESVLWRKKILHLSGGSADIQELLFGYLGQMEEVIESNHFGGDVFTFRKTTADLIQSSQTDQIIGKINDGVSLITFFGHAAVGTFDFSLEDPSRYDNIGRNPVILSLGCHSGNVHSEGIGLSEDFVLEKGKGAVAFIASSGTAYINPQYLSGINFYDIMGEDVADKNIGEIVIKSLTKMSATQNLETITLAQQLTIHGDPVLKIHMSSGPDYVSDYESFGVQPTIVNTTLDSFIFEFSIKNRGSFRKENIDILIQHKISTGELFSSQIITVAAPAFAQSYTITLPNPGIESVGKNDILITIDPNGKSEEFPAEIAENNNEILNPKGGANSYTFFILDNKAKPTYPQDFGILNDDVINLNATSDNGLMPLSTYLLEIDTTELFNSPLFTREEITSNNSVISWEPDITHLNGVVYYWRLSPGNLQDNELKWEGSSFLFSPGERDGWNQSHYFQWNKNDYNRLLLDSTSRELTFGKRTWDIRVKNELLNPQDFWVFINGTPWASLNARQLAPALSIFIWHPKDILFKNSGRDYGSLAFSSDAFLYRMNSPADRKNVSNLLYGAPDGSRVFIHTILRDEQSTLHIEDWQNDKETIGLDLFEVMKSFGAEKFDLLKERGTVPYTYIFDKGVGPVAEDIANSIFETIDLSSIGKTFWENGEMEAKVIGPVKRFMRLEWKEFKTITDETSLLIFGERADGGLDTLRRISNDYDVNLTFIHPDKYSKIKLVYETQDISDKSAAQLLWWRVFYQDLPDISFDIAEVIPNIPDTIESGTSLNLSYGVKNLSEQQIDSFKIKYTISGENEEYVFYSDNISLNGDELRPVDFAMSEILPQGEYKITVVLNDAQNPTERTFDNNIGILQFYVKGDKREPILEVKANGDFISNNDLLPPNTEIEIRFRTPALKILLEDPEIFHINLEYPNGQKTDITKNSFEFSPSENILDNTTLVTFSPLFNQQGRYLLKVKVEDKENKAFAVKEYEVSFYVNDQSLISSVNIFPNPMTTYAQIDLELVGADLPADFAINIFDSKGKRIGTIERSSFQNIKTGPFTRSHLWRAQNSEGYNLPSGTYLLNISGQKANESIVLNKKVVVVR